MLAHEPGPRLGLAARRARRYTASVIKVPYGELGLKIRAASAAAAALFAFSVLAYEQLPNHWALGIWALYGAGGVAGFFRVRRVDGDGETDIHHFFTSILPFYLLIPGVVWMMLAGEDGPGPSWGHWPVLGGSWTGSGLYFLFLGCVLVYNLLRLNLSRTLRRR